MAAVAHSRPISGPVATRVIATRRAWLAASPGRNDPATWDGSPNSLTAARAACSAVSPADRYASMASRSPAISRLNPDEKAAVHALIESMLLRHQARRLTTAPPPRRRPITTPQPATPATSIILMHRYVVGAERTQGTRTGSSQHGRRGGRPAASGKRLDEGGLRRLERRVHRRHPRRPLHSAQDALCDRLAAVAELPRDDLASAPERHRRTCRQEPPQDPRRRPRLISVTRLEWLPQERPRCGS